MFEGRKIAVFDCEIKKPIEQLSNGWKSYDEMGVSCLCLYDYQSGRYRVFDDKNIEEGIQILITYDFISGFNTVGFDWKLLLASYPNLGYIAPDDLGRSRPSFFDSAPRHFDVLREIWISRCLDPYVFNPRTHGGFKLDDVAADTIGMRKTLNGAQAPVLYQQGRLAEVIDYCLEDVRIEKTLFEFACKYGYIVRNGQIIQLNIPQELRLDAI